jgi:hypothetical protein
VAAFRDQHRFEGALFRSPGDDAALCHQYGGDLRSPARGDAPAGLALDHGSGSEIQRSHLEAVGVDAVAAEATDPGRSQQDRLLQTEPLNLAFSIGLNSHTLEVESKQPKMRSVHGGSAPDSE